MTKRETNKHKRSGRTKERDTHTERERLVNISKDPRRQFLNKERKGHWLYYSRTAWGMCLHPEWSSLDQWMHRHKALTRQGGRRCWRNCLGNIGMIPFYFSPYPGRSRSTPMQLHSVQWRFVHSHRGPRGLCAFGGTTWRSKGGGGKENPWSLQMLTFAHISIVFNCQ